ncbi:MAG: diaminopimelate decarboxylase [Thermodesulfobacteriota bacterium]|nr:diaminopimelate decarboxylase [Thermodesulfobacteriota bacterium]
MNFFEYVNNELYCEKVPLKNIADEVGTPVFVYSRQTLERHLRVFSEPFSSVSHLVCYSMKACSNLAILKIFSRLGAGVDIVSGGELYRALSAGVEPSRIVYSGVGKRASEIDEALLAGILMFNVESEAELELLEIRARSLGIKARIALRVNPDVDPKTHPYISTGLQKNKFGIDTSRALDLYKQTLKMDWIEPIGIDCHIGSQLTELGPILEAVEKLVGILEQLRSDGIDIQYLDIGGGLGIPYDQEEPPMPSEYGAAVVERMRDLGVTLILEPGRVLVGNAGILLTQVLYLKKTKKKLFVIVDAAMNDLIRPSLYDAHHVVQKVTLRPSQSSPDKLITVDIVGPICESGDYLAKSRELGEVAFGDHLAVMSAGAYGFSMSSNYNSRPRAPEVLVDGENYYIIRERETYADLVRGERIPPHLQ